MPGFKMPIFSRGNLLSQEMLEALRDYEVQLAQNTYAGYTDGIVTGTQISVKQGAICIGQGIVKFDERLFFIPSDTEIKIKPADEWQAVKVVFSELEKTKTFEQQEMTIEVSGNLQRERNKIEICRVRLQDGARLRSEYRNLEDMRTEYDTINVLEAQWSAYEKSSIHPQILMEFAKEARKGNVENSQDITFLQQILNSNGQALNRDLIQFYLDSRLGKKDEDYSNLEIYQGLCRALKQIRSGVEQRTEMRRPRRMIID